MPRIAVLGCKSTTVEFVTAMLRAGRTIDQLVTLGPDLAEQNQVAGFSDLRTLARDAAIPTYEVHSYSLLDERDIEQLKSRQIDCLFVIGWQRLVPSWWLDCLSLGAFGMHGSPEPLPRGRGRSPINWALASGATSFTTNLFRYDEGVDSGAIVASQKFDITPWDDCATLHHKNRIAMNRLVETNFDAIVGGKCQYVAQPADVTPTYLPKRSAADGRIVWERATMAWLHNHIRCQTRPFPGAFSHLEGDSAKTYLWAAHPFDSFITFAVETPGRIVERFGDGAFLIAVWDGSVLVRDWTSAPGTRIEVGMRFSDIPSDAAGEASSQEGVK